MSLNMDLGSWTIFSLLDREFTAQIRLACVFGNLGNEALIVTRDDEVSCANTAICMIDTKRDEVGTEDNLICSFLQVYALGSNGAGCLGLGDMHSTLTPKQVEPLCYKRVVGFAYGSGPHVLGKCEI